MDLYSTHVFMFPFQWEMKQEMETLFGKRYHLSNITASNDSPWRRAVMNYSDKEKVDLYNKSSLKR